MRVRLAVAVAALALLGTGCWGGEPGGERQTSTERSLVWGECPTDVEVTFNYPHACGVLTVPVDRDDPSKGTIGLTVARAQPQDGSDPDRFGFTYGTEFGNADVVSGGMTGTATTLDLVGVKLEWRGTGPRADPSLGCPEIGSLAPAFAAAPTGDRDAHARFVDAVRECAERLRAEGVDPADYDAAAMVADADALRKALGLDRWAVTSSYGTQSRLLVDAMSKHPDTLGTTYLDSPWPAHLDELTGGVLLTRATLERTFRACDAHPRCRGDRPLAAEWEAAMRRLAVAPLPGSHLGNDGRSVEVLVDDGKLLRAARYSMGGDGPDNLSRLPAMIRAAAQGRLHPRLAEIIGADPGLCVGYRPLCSGQDDIAWGVYLTHVCRDTLPFVDRDSLREATAGDPAFSAVFDAAPWDDVCEVWGVEAAEAAPATWPDRSPVPVLLMPGRYDSFTDLAWARRVAHADDQVQLLVGHGDTHNTLGFSACMRETRDAWAADPHVRLDPDRCRGDHVTWRR